MAKKRLSDRTVGMVQLAILVALVLLMAFTPVGYLKVGLVEITFITIPVVVGAMILGPGAGAFLGLVFGATSFIQALGTSAFGVALMAINPLYTALVCFIPRILMGWGCGLIFRALYRVDKTKLLSFLAASISGALLNTVLFMTALLALFGGTDYIQGMMSDLGAKSVLAFAVAFVGINGLVEAAVTALAGTAIGRALAGYIRPAPPQAAASEPAPEGASDWGGDKSSAATDAGSANSGETE